VGVGVKRIGKVHSLWLLANTGAGLGTHEYVGNEGVFTAPTWPVKLIVVIGCVVTMVLFLGFFWRHVRGLTGANQANGGGS